VSRAVGGSKALEAATALWQSADRTNKCCGAAEAKGSSLASQNKWEFAVGFRVF